MEDQLKLKKLLNIIVLVKKQQNLLESIGLSTEPSVESMPFMGNYYYQIYDCILELVHLFLNVKGRTEDINNLVMIGCDTEEAIDNTVFELLIIQQEELEKK